MTRIEKAVLWTLLYADVFDFPMTKREIHHFLVDTVASMDDVERALEHLNEHIICQTVEDQMYFAIRNRAQTVFASRQQRQLAAPQLWKKAMRYGAIMGFIPFVRMVSLTGALAMHNPSSEEDDIDYLLIIRPGRVWTARLFAVILVRVSKVFGVTLCPNYVLSEDTLTQRRQDIFIAHEIAQMCAISGHEVYSRMRQCNHWTELFLPNAKQMFHQETDRQPRGIIKLLKHFGEFVLGGKLGDRIERWEQKRKIHKFQEQINQESDVQLDEKHVKGHFDDHSNIILRKYHERLDQFGLSYPAFHISDFGESAAD
ncbi:MAG: hypothetical protein L0154_02255 [Chloroflexi bacterium]|nr:hypothetical protein [Chloroflexota bacterium]